MQNAARKFPVQAFDTPSPDLALEVKTDGRTYEKPPPPPPDPPEEEEKRDGPAEEDPDEEPDVFGPENGLPSEDAPVEPRAARNTPRDRAGQAAPDAGSSPAPRRSRQQGTPASPASSSAPASASPAADPAG